MLGARAWVGGCSAAELLRLQVARACGGCNVCARRLPHVTHLSRAQAQGKSGHNLPSSLCVCLCVSPRVAACPAAPPARHLQVVFTIHNMNYGQKKIAEAAEFCQRFTTVSPTYAFEVGGHPAIAGASATVHGVACVSCLCVCVLCVSHRSQRAQIGRQS